MSISKLILKALINNYHSEWDNGHPYIYSKAGTTLHEYEYGKLQLKIKTNVGLGTDVYGKNVLELGCGQGGICVFAAMLGAKKVVGIDLSDIALSAANNFKSSIELETNFTLPVEFEFMSAEDLKFDDAEFDLIIADNVFEHVDDLFLVLRECHRVLIGNGILMVPNFPSYLSKFGPHVKYGVKLPWVHIFFSETTIVQVMHDLAINDAKMFDFYPGLRRGATTFKELREYSDFNYITHKKFFDEVDKMGFVLETAFITRPNWAWLLFKIFPFLRKTRLDDILSIGTSVTLVKSS